MEYPDPIWQASIPASVDLSGAPSVLVGPNDIAYWAVSSRGSFSTVSTSKHAILLGAHDKNGTLLWTLQDPALYSNSADTQPKLAIGSEGELYVVYTTTGSTPGNKNMENVFSICGSCSLLKGPEDIVVARINIAENVPTVAWVLQDSTLNSCARETAPSIVFNMATNQLVLSYQSTGSTLCTARVGSPNIVLVAITPSGGLAWALQNDLLNSKQQNGTPSITYDNDGNIYLAYTITGVVPGGTFLGVKDVEVVRIHPEGSPVNMIRDWILSASFTLSTPLLDKDPAIVCDRDRNLLYVAFCTNGTVTGGTHSNAITDLVLTAFTTSGQHLWSFQSPEINEASYEYTSIDNPSLALDSNGNVYVACHAISIGGKDMILLFRFESNSPTTSWLFTCGYKTYRAYVPAGLQGSPRSISFVTSGSYSPPSLAIQEGNLYLAFNEFSSTDVFYLTALRQQYPFEDTTAFGYMLDYVGACRNCTD
jgi:hypothetical protein